MSCEGSRALPERFVLLANLRAGLPDAVAPCFGVATCPLDDCRAIGKDRSRVETQLLVAHPNRAKVLAGEPWQQLEATRQRPAPRGDRVVSGGACSGFRGLDGQRLTLTNSNTSLPGRFG